MNGITKKNIGRRLNEVLAQKGIMQKELAEHIGVTANTVSYYLSGERCPDVEKLIEIAKYLNVTTDYLLGISDVKSLNTELKTICEYTGLNEKSVEFLHKILLRSKNILIEKGYQNDIDEIASKRPKYLRFAEEYYNDNPSVQGTYSLEQWKETYLENLDEEIAIVLSNNSFKAELIKQAVNLILSHNLSEKLLNSLSLYLQTNFKSNRIITGVITDERSTCENSLEKSLSIQIDTCNLENAYLFNVLEILKKINEQQAAYSLVDIGGDLYNGEHN